VTTRQRWPRFQASRNAGFIVKSSDLALNVEYEIFSSFAQCGSRPQRIIFGMRLPPSDRTATNIGAVGGLFQSASKFGAGAAASNMSLILISE
jgi:hypothetical protein